MDRHPRQRGGQLPVASGRPSQVKRQVRGGRLRGGGRGGHAPPCEGLQAVPGHVGCGFPQREPEPHPAGQRPQQPRGSGQAARADQEAVRGFGDRARRQLLAHRVPRPRGQPAPSAQVNGGPVGRRHRLGADAAVKTHGLADGGQRRGGQQRPGRQVPGGETGHGRDGAAHLSEPEPGPPRPPPPRGLAGGGGRCRHRFCTLGRHSHHGGPVHSQPAHFAPRIPLRRVAAPL